MADPSKWKSQRGGDERPHIFVCSHPGCQTTFSRNDRLIIHLRTHSGEKPFVCAEAGCGRSYARAAHLQRHHRTAHEDQGQQVIHRCEVPGCDQTFTNQSNLKRHYERLHQQKRYQCQFEGCKKSFLKNHQLKTHESVHTNVQPYVCPVESCGKSFSLPSRLRRHQKVHQGYMCTEEGCDAQFEKWTQLVKHRTVSHRPDFRCENCGKVFSQQNRLTSHQLVHADSREVFECPRGDCGRVYLHQKQLRAHIRSYHDGVRFPCQECSRTFSTKQKLNQHQRIHDPDRPPPKKKSRKGQRKKSMALKLSALGLHEKSDSEADGSSSKIPDGIISEGIPMDSKVSHASTEDAKPQTLEKQESEPSYRPDLICPEQAEELSTIVDHIERSALERKDSERLELLSVYCDKESAVSLEKDEQSKEERTAGSKLKTILESESFLEKLKPIENSSNDNVDCADAEVDDASSNMHNDIICEGNLMNSEVSHVEAGTLENQDSECVTLKRTSYILVHEEEQSVTTVDHCQVSVLEQKHCQGLKLSSECCDKVSPLSPVKTDMSEGEMPAESDQSESFCVITEPMQNLMNDDVDNTVKLSLLSHSDSCTVPKSSVLQPKSDIAISRTSVDGQIKNEENILLNRIPQKNLIMLMQSGSGNCEEVTVKTIMPVETGMEAVKDEKDESQIHLSQDSAFYEMETEVDVENPFTCKRSNMLIHPLGIGHVMKSSCGTEVEQCLDNFSSKSSVTCEKDTPEVLDATRTTQVDHTCDEIQSAIIPIQPNEFIKPSQGYSENLVVDTVEVKHLDSLDSTDKLGQQVSSTPSYSEETKTNSSDMFKSIVVNGEVGGESFSVTVRPTGVYVKRFQ